MENNNRLAVCIPVYNEGKNIFNLLAEIEKQDLKCNFLIIIIASGCSDDTISEIKRAKKYLTKEIFIIIENHRYGKGNALNLGMNFLREMKVDLVFFIDGDIQLLNNSFSLLLTELESKDLDCVCANPIPTNISNNIYNLIAHENCVIWDNIRSLGNQRNQVWYISGYLYLIKCRCLPEFIPFGIINDDSYIGLFVIENQNKMGYEPCSKVLVNFPNNFQDYFLQKNRTRLGWLQLKKINNQRIRLLIKKQRIECIKRTFSGYPLAFACFLINEIIYFSAKLTLNKKQYYIWEQVKSTK